MTTASRHRLLGGREGEAVRDLSNAIGRQVRMELLEFTSLYTEPMAVSFPRSPKGVLVVRVQEAQSPETPVACGSVASFTSVASGFRIDSIEGPVIGTSYRFTLLAIG